MILHSDGLFYTNNCPNLKDILSNSHIERLKPDNVWHFLHEKSLKWLIIYPNSCSSTQHIFFLSILRMHGMLYCKSCYTRKSWFVHVVRFHESIFRTVPNGHIWSWNAGCHTERRDPLKYLSTGITTQTLWQPLLEGIPTWLITALSGCELLFLEN